MNYTELKAEVAAWMHRTDLTSNIPTFINLAERDMKRSLRAYEMLSEESIGATAGNREAPLPANFVQMRNLRINNDKYGKVLTFRPSSALFDIEPQSGDPKHFSYANGKIILSPKPSDDLTLIAECYVMPADLSDAAPTNALLTAYPNLYLNMALKHAFRYVRNKDKSMEFDAYARQDIAEINKDTRKLLSSGTFDSMKPFKRNIP